MDELTGYSTYEYHSNGVVKEEINYESNDDISSIYKYNEEGKQIEYIAFYYDGRSHKEEYDSNGNVTKETNYDAEGLITYYKVYQYDENGTYIGFIEYDADGNIIE